MATKHIADAESTFKVLNIDPDMCFVNGTVVPFEIYRELPPEKSNYAHTVHARGCMVLHVDSVIQGVIGNAGEGIKSGVSVGKGHIQVIKGCGNVLVQKRRVARHLDPVEMNGDA